MNDTISIRRLIKTFRIEILVIEHLPQELRDRFTDMREMDLTVQSKCNGQIQSESEFSFPLSLFLYLRSCIFFTLLLT